MDAFMAKLNCMCGPGGLKCGCCNHTTRDKPVAARRVRRQLRNDVRNDIEQQLEDEEGAINDIVAESSADREYDIPVGFMVRDDGLVVVDTNYNDDYLWIDEENE